jgi:hypothetical protein
VRRFLNPDEPTSGAEHKAIRKLALAGRLFPRPGVERYLNAARRAIRLLDGYHSRKRGAKFALRHPEEVLDEILATVHPSILFRRADGRYEVAPRGIKNRLRGRRYALTAPLTEGEPAASRSECADALACRGAIDAKRLVTSLRRRCEERAHVSATSKHVSAVRGWLWQLVCNDVSQAEVARWADCSQADVSRALKKEQRWLFGGDQTLRRALLELMGIRARRP